MKKMKRSITSSSAAPNWHKALIVEPERFLGWPNVVSVSLGWKERKSTMTARFCVKIYVSEKLPVNRLKGQQLPRTAKVLVPVGKGLYRTRRVPTDVVWYAKPEFCGTPSSLLNPIPSGAQIGAGTDPGTHCCRVVDSAGHIFGLTVGHLFNAVTGPVAPNLDVFQPVLAPPGSPPAAIHLGRTVNGFMGNSQGGFVDFALFDIDAGRQVSSLTFDNQPIGNSVLTAAHTKQLRVPVTKFGAVTRRTRAAFSTEHPSILIGAVTATKVLEFLGEPGQAFAQRGDSGALVFSTHPGALGALVGMLIATSPPGPGAPGGRGFVIPFDRLSGLRPF